MTIERTGALSCDVCFNSQSVPRFAADPLLYRRVSVLWSGALYPNVTGNLVSIVLTVCISPVY